LYASIRQPSTFSSYTQPSRWKGSRTSVGAMGVYWDSTNTDSTLGAPGLKFVAIDLVLLRGRTLGFQPGPRTQPRTRRPLMFGEAMLVLAVTVLLSVVPVAAAPGGGGTGGNPALQQCQASLNTCTANLSSANANLTSCTATLNTANSNLSTCNANYSTCS